MKKSLISLVLTFIMLLSVSTVALADGEAQVIDKASLKSGDTIATVRYNVETGEYAYGSMSINYNGRYLVYDENTFSESAGAISNSIKVKTGNVLSGTQNYIDLNLSKLDLKLYGHIDSESWQYSGIAISTYVMPDLIAANIGIEDNIWLCWGDRNGHVTDVYISVAPSDVVKGDTYSVSVVTPKKMSIRLQDGTVLKNGDGFNVEIGEEIKFQMCSNNWDNDTYDDNGNGLCGTVVYTVKVSNDYNGRSYDAATHTFTLPKGDRVLRTDVNKCFMAYRYHFTKGDYNKQTGIVNVINTPLESLSVNLPLGSTVTSDAYKGYGKIDSANVFIQNSDDLELSYTDYYWEY